MYTPESFKVSDLQTLHLDMERWNFATLITPDAEGGLQVTHLPLLLKRDAGGLGVLAGHMAEANAHWKAFNAARESLAIFHGPHAYISPRWYRTDQAVPTWNYVVVHAFGLPRLVQGTESMQAHLMQLIQHHEGTGPESWRPEKLSRETYAALLQGIVCFEMPILRIEGKAKLGQNRSRGDVEGLIRGLRATDRAANHELAEMTQSRVLDLSESGAIPRLRSEAAFNRASHRKVRRRNEATRGAAPIRLICGNGLNSDNGLEESPRAQHSPDIPNDALGSIVGTTRRRQDTSAVPAFPDLGMGPAESLPPDSARAEPFGVRFRPSNVGRRETPGERPHPAARVRASYADSSRPASLRSASRDCGESVRRWARANAVRSRSAFAGDRKR